MTNYEELVKALLETDSSDWKRLSLDAAAVIETLDRLLDQNTQRCEALRKQLREAHESYERHLNELEAQLPKRGKWELIDGAEPMRWGCSRCKYLSWETSNYCPRCGAKMEVQE